MRDVATRKVTEDAWSALLVQTIEQESRKRKLGIVETREKRNVVRLVSKGTYSIQ